MLFEVIVALGLMALLHGVGYWIGYKHGWQSGAAALDLDLSMLQHAFDDEDEIGAAYGDFASVADVPLVTESGNRLEERYDPRPMI